MKEVNPLPAFEKDALRKKDEQRLEEMQEEIDNAEADAAGAEQAADSSEAGESQAEGGAEQQEDLSGKLDELQQQLDEKDKRYVRLQADFENFRRRSGKEREELSAVITQEILKDMLPILDNFERAMAAETKDAEAFQKGVEMIFTQFQEVLKKDGLEKIETEGQKFDPNFHQAVMRVQNPELEDDTIAQELQKGYIVKGKVIRPSMVQVVAN